jgi:hypothetical protein
METEDAGTFEAGALAALDHIADAHPELEDVTMEAAEYIGKLIDEKRDLGELR